MRISDWSSDVCSSDLIALDIGSSSAALDSRIREGSHLWIDWQSDDVFYSVKGQMYAYDLLLRELRQDFSNVIRDREIGGAWDPMMSSFSEAASMQPLVCSNAATVGVILPHHLASHTGR